MTKDMTSVLVVKTKEVINQSIVFTHKSGEYDMLLKECSAELLGQYYFLFGFKMSVTFH